MFTLAISCLTTLNLPCQLGLSVICEIYTTLCALESVVKWFQEAILLFVNLVEETNSKIKYWD